MAIFSSDTIHIIVLFVGIRVDLPKIESAKADSRSGLSMALHGLIYKSFQTAKFVSRCDRETDWLY